MKLRFQPPYIFAHRVYLEANELEIHRSLIEPIFGLSTTNSLGGRWMMGHSAIQKGAETFYGFRTAEDQMLFYMKFSGKNNIAG